jgi:RNA polymerase sigma-70 factor (ECF subfamily)
MPLRSDIPPLVSHIPADGRLTVMDARSESITDVSLQAGNAVPSSFEEIFRTHYARIARVIARIVHDPGRAEELAAEVFWKYLRGRGAAHGTADESPGGWLYRAAVRKGLDELRSQKRQEKYRPLLSFLGLAASPSPEQLHAAIQEQAQVRAVLAVLKRRDSELLVLRSEGLSYQEIAGILRLNETSIGTLLRRAQDAFRKEYVNRYGPQNF